MRKLFITTLLILITTLCIGYSNAADINVAKHKTYTNEIYTQKQDVEQTQPTIVYITATASKYH